MIDSRAASAVGADALAACTADGPFEPFAERRKGKEATVWPVVQTVFGRTPTSFDDFASRHAAIFRGEQPAPKV